MSEHLEPDELLVVREYRKIKSSVHGDLEISVKDGRLTKVWPTPKVDIDEQLKGIKKLRGID